VRKLQVENRESRGLQFRIEVDGGVHHDTVASIVRAGTQILVAGSAIFENAPYSKTGISGTNLRIFGSSGTDGTFSGILSAFETLPLSARNT
jgi:hypothetical protein